MNAQNPPPRTIRLYPAGGATPPLRTPPQSASLTAPPAQGSQTGAEGSAPTGAPLRRFAPALPLTGASQGCRAFSHPFCHTWQGRWTWDDAPSAKTRRGAVAAPAPCDVLQGGRRNAAPTVYCLLPRALRTLSYGQRPLLPTAYSLFPDQSLYPAPMNCATSRPVSSVTSTM